ncbi:MAG: ribbon-helix-helix protein, CopG family [Deltaproteobacteria bacterium]|nr:ribbon-helix-helix protein, CopG family [Deltaproteobacteria bacterium]
MVRTHIQMTEEQVERLKKAASIEHRSMADLIREAVRTFNDDVLPLRNIEWVDETIHNAGVSALNVASRRKFSLVDCVSFEAMRRLGIKTVFAFDQHFKEQGFQCMP